MIHGRPRNSGVLHVRQGVHRPFLGARRPAAGVEGGLSAARDPARRALRDAGRGGGLRRGRALGPAQARLSAPAPAVRARHPLARHAQRRDERAAGAPLRRVLHRLGGEPARGGARHRGDRRQDLAAEPGEGQRSAAPRLGLGEPAAPGARPGGGGGEVERDRCDPAAARAARARGRARHHRRHGLPDRDRQGDPRQGRRLSPRAEGQLAGARRGGAPLLRHRARRRRSPPTRPPTATTAASRSAAPSSATTSAGSPPTGASPASGASRASR